MNKQIVSGLIGVIGGSAWLANNAQYYDEQGIVAIGMPLLIAAAGLIYIVLGFQTRRDR